MTSRLHRLSSLGQSVWIDFLSRDLIESGSLARAIEEDAVVGVTSNPTIFERAISHGNAYDRQVAMEGEAASAKRILLALAMSDVSSACDLLKPLWQKTRGGDGYVSIEVDPHLAGDIGATVEEATLLHEAIGRPTCLSRFQPLARASPRSRR